MKTIKQICLAKAKSLPLATDGAPRPEEVARLEHETFFAFWTTYLIMLNPHGRRRSFVDWTAEEIFNPTLSRRLTPDEIVTSMRLMREHLRVERLSFGTHFRLRGILFAACQLAKTRGDADVILCALMVFVQLELGATPDPEYGNFPQRPGRPANWFDDKDLSDDPVLAAIELEERHDASMPYGTSEYNADMRFAYLVSVIKDRDKFATKFPGASRHHSNVLKAARPLFTHPDLDDRSLTLFLDWVEQLLQSPLQENALDGARGAEADDAA